MRSRPRLRAESAGPAGALAALVLLCLGQRAAARPLPPYKIPKETPKRSCPRLRAVGALAALVLLGLGQRAAARAIAAARHA